MNGLKKVREESGLTQEDVARVLKVHPLSYTRYELETRGLKDKTLILLADFFSRVLNRPVTTDELLGRPATTQTAKAVNE